MQLIFFSFEVFDQVCKGFIILSFLLLQGGEKRKCISCIFLFFHLGDFSIHVENLVTIKIAVFGPDFPRNQNFCQFLVIFQFFSVNILHIFMLILCKFSPAEVKISFLL